MALCLDDHVAGTVYLEPQEFSSNIGRMERLTSVNDSGIVDLHGSRSSSRIGMSIPNDSYRCFDSDQENPPVTPRAFYPTPQRSNGHAPLSTQFSYPFCAPKSNPLPSKLAPFSNRTRDDPNIYTSIDEASLLTNHGDSPSKSGDSAPLVCSYRPTAGSRQVSVDSAQSKGRVNLLYVEPPGADRRGGSGRAQGAGKTGPLSGKCCLNVFFGLIAVAAFALALIQMLRSSMDNRHEQLEADYDSVKKANEEMKRTQLRIENDFSEMKQLLKEVESKAGSAVKHMDQLDSQRNEQLRMHIGGLLPVNMSACEYIAQRKGIAASEAEHSTDSLNLTGKFVLRAFCTTEGGREAFLQYDSSRPNIYTCTCRGQHMEIASRFCILHCWICPYI